MILYIIRPGLALEPQYDPERGLTERGKVEAEKLSALLGRAGVRVSRTLHSPKKRARETAEILAGSVMDDGGPTETGGLLPNDDPADWAERLGEVRADLMLVGHLPYMETLTSLLLTGDGRAVSVFFETATAVCLEGSGSSLWSLRWMVTPEVAGK